MTRFKNYKSQYEGALSVTVTVIRNGKEDVFALSRANAPFFFSPLPRGVG